MKDNANNGFELISTRPLEEINATLYEFSHPKSGASLIYLDREDDNKTFAIGFATPPKNDTGVFHIIEHSVLCGSKKYPLNDPFAELLKGSLNTFLNAITYEDRTIYPVSSRCERDFLNLVDVYMDAVLAPNMLSNPLIFGQEGWHYEYDEESSELSLNGVVYNEMKGAYSSPDELGGECLNRTLFEGTLYSCDSGGKPSAIPSLSYEEFKETYEKHYHPSNSKIFLDGRMDIDRVLSLIDSHLSRYDRREPVSLKGESTPRIAPPVEISYEISENESEEGKTRVLYGYVFSDYTNDEANLTASILSDILCGSNASPLKKAILERGLAKDVAMYSQKSREQTLVIEIRDADEERLDELDSLINEIIRSTAECGIEKDKITSSLNSIEFRLRERDYGTLPTGIVFAMSVYGKWIYGAAPEDALLLNDTVEAVKAKINTDHFEKSLLQMTVNNPHRAKVIMRPDKTLAERSAKEEKERLGKLLSSMTEEELSKIKEEHKALRLWQQREPTEEEINSLPKLSLSDIPKEFNRPTVSVSENNDVKILKCPTKTDGIIYLSLFFDCSDISGEELLKLSMLSAALVNFPTEERDALSLQNDIKANLGSLFASYAVGIKDNITTPYLKIGGKALTSKSDDLVRLIGELLLKSRIDNHAEMGNIISQAKSHLEDILYSSGETVALSRLEASRSEAGAVAEYLSGYEAYLLLSKLCKDEARIKDFTKSVSDLLEKLTDKRRLTVAITGDISDELVAKLISLFPDREEIIEKKNTPLCAESEEFFLLPTKVGYAVMGGKHQDVCENLGILRVARSILSYEYLWNTVRVQSGAYGTGFIPRRDGGLAFYSYRDPSPARSLEFYRQSADYLRALAENGEDITKFIIGAIGEYDTLITPRTAAVLSANDYLNGWGEEDEKKIRSQMLNMTAKDLLTVADIIDKVLSDPGTIIVGGGEHLESLDHTPEKIYTI